jgi:hypothetical protein
MTPTRRSFLAVGCAAVAGAAFGRSPSADAATWETVIDGSFASYSALEAAWNYRYPWGSDHNGSARMYGSSSDHNHVYLESSGVLAIKATRITWDEGNSSASPYLPIHYHSGAIHAKQQVLVNDQFPNWEVKGEFQAPSARGTWPAFWLTGATSWPPESDILEYKGDARNWFNTYDGEWESTIVDVPDPGAWHSYRAHLSMANDNDVTIDYYLDDRHVGTHTGSNFVGEPMWVILNLQMEGSSGEPGPTTDTLYHARNVSVARNSAS